MIQFLSRRPWAVVASTAAIVVAAGLVWSLAGGDGPSIEPIRAAASTTGDLVPYQAPPLKTPIVAEDGETTDIAVQADELVADDSGTPEVDVADRESAAEEPATETGVEPAEPKAGEGETVENDTEPSPSDDQRPEGTDDEEDRATYILRYRFEAGTGLHYSVTQRSFIRTTKAELEDRTKSGTEIAKHLRIISVDEDGTALVETAIDHVRMAVQFDDAVPTTFDSRDGEEPPKQFRDLAEKVGRPLARMRVSRRGELLQLTRLDGKAPESQTDIGVTDNVLVEFPERPLHVGESWRQEFEVDVLVTNTLKRKAKLQRTFTLASVEDGIATIDFEIAILSIVRDPQISIQLLQRTPKGRIVFDLEAGRIVSRSQSSREHIFGPFGPGSEMLATSQRSERLGKPKATEPEKSEPEKAEPEDEAAE